MGKKTQSQWIIECWDELDAVESIFAEDPFSNTPEWVEASATEVVLASHRSLKRKTGRTSDAQVLGAMVGYQEVLLDYIDRLEKGDSDTDEQLPDTLTEFYEQHKEKIDRCEHRTVIIPIYHSTAYRLKETIVTVSFVYGIQILLRFVVFPR